MSDGNVFLSILQMVFDRRQVTNGSKLCSTFLEVMHVLNEEKLSEYFTCITDSTINWIAK